MTRPGATAEPMAIQHMRNQVETLRKHGLNTTFNTTSEEFGEIITYIDAFRARAESAEKRAEEEQTKRIDAEVMASIDKVEATECIELKNALGIEWDSGGDEYSTQRWVTVDALDDQTFDNMTKAGEAIIAQLATANAALARVRADSERLDWLDAINEKTNRRNGTVYGWGLTINHNRTALEDHHFPARTVREALDAAIESAT